MEPGPAPLPMMSQLQEFTLERTGGGGTHLRVSFLMPAVICGVPLVAC